MKKAIVPKDLSTQDWFKSLVDDCGSLLTEAYEHSNWIIIIAHHTVGKRIIAEAEKLEITALIREMSYAMNRSERDLFYSVQFARRFPVAENLASELPDGKNARWSTAIKSLGDGKKKELEGDHRHEWLTTTTCKICGKVR